MRAWRKNPAAQRQFLESKLQGPTSDIARWRLYMVPLHEPTLGTSEGNPPLVCACEAAAKIARQISQQILRHLAFIAKTLPFQIPLSFDLCSGGLRVLVDFALR